MSSVQKKKKKKVKVKVATPASNLQISGGEKQESSREMEWQIVDPNSTFFTSSFKLPRGWSVEERPRTHSPTHPGRIDKVLQFLYLRNALKIFYLRKVAGKELGFDS